MPMTSPAKADPASEAAAMDFTIRAYSLHQLHSTLKGWVQPARKTIIAIIAHCSDKHGVSHNRARRNEAATNNTFEQGTML